ncbi:MAG: hypothetical protein ACOC0N_10480 [Chroococcales cyanobacterium]
MAIEQRRPTNELIDILSSPEARDSSDLTEVSCKHFILTAAHSQLVSLFKNTFLVLEYFDVATDFWQQPMYSFFKVQISGEPFSLLPDTAIIHRHRYPLIHPVAESEGLLRV